MASLVNHARLAFAAVEQLDKATDPQGLIIGFRSCLDPFGFNVVLITGLPDPPADPTPFFLLNGWPAGWYERYLAQDFYRDDPVAAFARTRVDPFDWADAPVNMAHLPRARQVMAEAADAGLRSGFLVPIVTSQSVQACVSVAGEAPDRDPDVKRMIHLVGMYAHARAVRLHMREKRAQTPAQRS